MKELKSYSFLRRISKIFASIVIDIIDLEFSQTNLLKSIARVQVAFSPKRNRLKTIIMIWILSRTMISRAGGRCQGSLAPFWCFGNFLEISVGLFLIRGSPEHSKKLSFSSWLALKWLLPPFQHLGYRIQHLFRQYVMWWRRRTYKYWFPIQPPRRLRLLRSKSHPEELLLASQLPLQPSLLPDSQLNIILSLYPQPPFQIWSKAANIFLFQGGRNKYQIMI